MELLDQRERERVRRTDSCDERQSVEQRHGESPRLPDRVALFQHNVTQSADDLVLVVAHFHTGQMGPIVPVKDVEVLRDGPQPVHRRHGFLQQTSVRFVVVGRRSFGLDGLLVAQHHEHDSARHQVDEQKERNAHC